MKILLIGNYAYQAQESMQRFAFVLSQGLMEAGHEVRVLRPKAYLGRLCPSATGIGKWLGYIDRFVVFPFILRRVLRWPDVVHVCDQANAMYVQYLASLPYIVTCHDMLAIRSALGEISRNPTQWTGVRLQRMILDSLNHSKRVICVSQTTMEDLLRISKLQADQVGIVPNGLNYPYRPMALVEVRHRLANLGLKDSWPFFLHVGGNQWYKNRSGVLRIFSRLATMRSNHRLVMVGQPLTPEMKRVVTQQGLEERVIELHGVSNEDLRALYSSADALLFPSWNEGFGWPIIEAQACGCPVVTSYRSPMKEVAGDAAVYIDPDDINAAAQIINAGFPKFAKLRKEGQINAKCFDLKKMVHAYIQEYEKLLGEDIRPDVSIRRHESSM